jgi:class 3 adenylate cyclase
MTIRDDLNAYVKQSFDQQWTTRVGQKVPEPGDIKLNNDAVQLTATILYADLADSTKLVKAEKPSFASEVYESYVYCAARLIRNRGGSVTAYDGDRVMGVFIGDSKNSNAARCALEINYAVSKIINPALKSQYPNSAYKVEQKVGIDTSDVWVVNTGIRGNNDHVWVGPAANNAAKLAGLKLGYASYITQAVYSRLMETSKFAGNPKVDMWTTLGHQTGVGTTVYGSRYTWAV